MIYIICYVLIVNAITLIAYGVDKMKAKRHLWRISESRLILLAWIGGSIGAMCGIYLFHHKTLHKKFSLGVPLILILQIAAIVAVTLSL